MPARAPTNVPSPRWMWTASVPVTQDAVHTGSSVGTDRIFQSLQTWVSPGDPANGPATMWTSYGLMTAPSLGGSVICGAATAARAVPPERATPNTAAAAARTPAAHTPNQCDAV